MKTPYKPYVYFLYHKPTGLKYIGAEYSKGKKISNPENLFTVYFTSSSLIKTLIKEYGEDSFYIRILKIFETSEETIEYEKRLLELSKTKNNYLNICKSSGFDLRTCSAAGKVGGSIVKKRKIGIFRSEEERLRWAKMGAKASMESGNNTEFLYWASPEGRRKRASMGGKKAGGWGKKDHSGKIWSASDAGKKGGPKNKGYSWITDGNKSIKYTVKMKEEKPIQDFLLENPEYRLGRIKP
jgi:hypothetical protein